MIKSIPPKDVQIGMYVQGFEGSWFAHPFWRTRFVITSQAQLETVRSSAVDGVIVDLSRSVVAKQPAGEGAKIGSRTSAQDPRGQDRVSAPVTREFFRAAHLVEKSKRALQRLFDSARTDGAIDGQELRDLVDDISTSLAQNPDAFVSIARMKQKHEYTFMHSVAVCALMIGFARRLGLSEDEVREAGLGGLVHDIGKATVPNSILDKPGELTESEWRLVKRHPSAGYDLLRRTDGMLPGMLDVCLHHHERVDGSGYPDGLAGPKLSLFAQMGAICDVYDAITSARAYKQAWDPAEAVRRMQSWKGHFDEDLLNVFARSIALYPLGAVVRLSDGSIGMVCGVRPTDPACPPVFLLTQLAPGQWGISLSSTVTKEIVHVEDPAALQISNIEALRLASLKAGLVGEQD